MALQETARVVTSKSAKRAVVNTIILFAGASTLLFLASIGSALFFQNFVPDQVVSRPVYLQYGYGSSRPDRTRLTVRTSDPESIRMG